MREHISHEATLCGSALHASLTGGRWARMGLHRASRARRRAEEHGRTRPVLADAEAVQVRANLHAQEPFRPMKPTEFCLYLCTVIELIVVCRCVVHERSLWE